MAKSHNQKIKILILAEILKGTDVHKVVTMQEILDRIGQHGISAERKSIYDDMEALRDFGYDIQYKRGRTGGCRQIQRRKEAPVQKRLRGRRLRRGDSAGKRSAIPTGI